MLTYGALSRSKLSYDNKEVNRLIVIIRKSSKHSLVEKSKVEITMRLSHIIIKNTENFFNLIKNIKKEAIHTKDDLIGECYIILEKCLKDFDIGKGKQFYWYYNKSLTRGLQRIIEKNYHKHRMMDVVDDEAHGYLFLSPPNQEDGLIKLYMDKFKLDKTERKVLMSKIHKEKIQDFLQKNKEITWNRYFLVLNSVKAKLEPVRQDLENII